MTRRSKLWLLGAAAVLAITNLGGAGYAAAMGEPLHASAHLAVLVLVVGACLVWRRGRAEHENLPRTQPADERLEYLQQSVDAMALELERLGEKQRFSDKLQMERGETPPPRKDQ